MLRWYIRFLDKTLPIFLHCPVLYTIVAEFRHELDQKLQNKK